MATIPYDVNTALVPAALRAIQVGACLQLLALAPSHVLAALLRACAPRAPAATPASAPGYPIAGAGGRRHLGPCHGGRGS